MDEENDSNFNSSYDHFLNTSAGQSWSGSGSTSVDLGLPIDDVPISLGMKSGNSSAGSSYSKLSDQEKAALQSQTRQKIRKSLATTAQWQAWTDCLKNLGQGLDGELKSSDDNPQVARLTLSFHRISDSVPAPIVTSFQVIGGDKYDDWVGQSVAKPLSQLIQRRPGQALSVNIVTTLDTFGASLSAEGQIAVADIPLPVCQPCPPPGPGPVMATMPTWESIPGIPCEMRFFQDWKYRLSSKGLSPEYAERRPLTYRMNYMKAQCELIWARALQMTHLPTLVNQNANDYNAAESQYEQRNNQLAQRAQDAIGDANAHLDILKDKSYSQEMPQFPTVKDFLCSNQFQMFPTPPPNTTVANNPNVALCAGYAPP